MGIVENLTNSFSYATDGLVGKWGRWIALIIGTIIFPIIMGYALRVLKGGETAPESDNYVGMFIDGIKMFIINIVYMIIPLIIGFAIFAMSGGLGAMTMLGMNVDNPAAYAAIILGTLGLSFVIFIIVAFIFSLFAIIGTIRFARTGSMGEAFAFSEILAKIGSIGWVSYIIALIVIGVVMMIIYMILGMIPVIGWLLTLILAPYLYIVTFRYYSLLYDSGA